MSLKTLRADISAKLAFGNTDAEQAFVKMFINRAAEEIWVNNTLPGATREIVLYYDGTSKQIALPYFIQTGLGFRFYNSQYKIPINGMEPRYQYQGYGQYSLNWREKFKSPVAILVTNQSTITFRLVKKESVDIDIYIVGQTPAAFKVQEKVTITAGEYTVETTNDWVTVNSITKGAVNNFDISVEDADLTVIGEIPNSELRANYTIMQVLDDNIEGSNLISGVEVLYKPVYTTFVNDYDEFTIPGYEQAIYWKVMEHYHGRQDDSEAVNRAVAAQTKCKQLLDEIASSAIVGREMEIQFGPNRFYGLFRPSSWSGVRIRN